MTRNYEEKLSREIITGKYKEKLSGEIIRRNYQEKLSKEILTQNSDLVYYVTQKCVNYRDTGVSNNRHK